MPHTTDRVTSAAHLAALPDDGNRYELVNGVLHTMSPAGGRHGRIALRFAARLAIHVERHNLGQTFAAETGFLLHQDPDTVRAPDAAFVSQARIGEFADYPGFLPVAPDVVAEVVSPNDRSSEVEAKAQSWLAAGVQTVLVVDPQTSTIREYRQEGHIRVYSKGFVDMGDVLPEFQLDVGELFA